MCGVLPPAKMVDAMSEQGFPFFPATLEFLILSLKTQTELQLGLLLTGDEKDRPQPELRIARHSIDLLAMLQEKTRGNCTIEEQRLLDNSVTELRFRFVQASEEQERNAAASQENAAPAEEKTEGQAGS
jgi:Domain of unknown function (DUF1844)